LLISFTYKSTTIQSTSNY